MIIIRVTSYNIRNDSDFICHEFLIKIFIVKNVRTRQLEVFLSKFLRRLNSNGEALNCFLNAEENLL